MAQALLPRYAQAQTISFTDPRIKAQYVSYPSPGGNSGKMRGYLVQPAGSGPFPAVLVIHENRGLNPYIEDVARRAAADGFLALAPDGLFPVGGYPGNDDDGRTLQAGLDQGKLRTDMLNSARYREGAQAVDRQARRHRLLLGRRHDQLPRRRRWAPTCTPACRSTAPRRRPPSVPKIKAPLLIQFAETDERINEMWPAYEAALKAAGVPYEAHIYPGTQHGFHNNSTPRYQEAAAKLSWDRTIAHFKKHLPDPGLAPSLRRASGQTHFRVHPWGNGRPEPAHPRENSA